MLRRRRCSRSGAALVAVVGIACGNEASDPPPVVAPTAVEDRAPAPLEPVAPEQAPVDDAGADAPVDPPVSAGPGRGERLNPEIAGLGTDVLLAAFPERMAGWVRVAANAHAAGTAGRWADGASATYRYEEREIDVDVTDMIRVNACTPGTGLAILEQSLSTVPGAERVILDGFPGVRWPVADGTALRLWLGDRCQLELRTSNAKGIALVGLGTGLRLHELAAACSSREPALRR